MLDRIASCLTGIMCFLYLINFTVHKHVKIGEKYIKFDDAGILWVLPAIVFLIMGIYGFYFAFRSEKNIKRYPKYMCVRTAVNFTCTKMSKIRIKFARTAAKSLQSIMTATTGEETLLIKALKLRRSKSVNLKSDEILICYTRNI